jgi:hypothetical protein
MRSQVLRFTAALLPTLLLCACGGSDEAAGTPATVAVQQPAPQVQAPPVVADPAPAPQTLSATLSGVPAAQVTAGTAYTFSPVLAAPLPGFSFTVQGKPAWATFNIVNGSLSGVPLPEHAGTTSAIVISATNGQVAAQLAPFTITVTVPVVATASASSAVTLSWLPPAQNMDGTAAMQIGGYYVYSGPSAQSLAQRAKLTGAGTTSHTLTGLAAGTHHFAISAYTTGSIEGELSPSVSKKL